jgi:hypothetical protein
MKIVKVLGGLGNQMFQYSFYKSLQERFNTIKVDLSEFKNYQLHNSYELGRIFNISVEESTFLSNLLIGSANRDLISRVTKKLIGLRSSYYEQSSPSVFDPNIYTNLANCYLDGYWQNERYFKNIEQQIRKDFAFPKLKDSKNQRLLEKVSQGISVSIHVRRGDYVDHPLLGNICTEEYYQLAVNYFSEQYDGVKYIVFSNDQTWCKNNLNIKGTSTYVDWNVQEDSFKDMQLMSYCTHNIVANSSFSWWGAWLNSNMDKKVIAPKRWFNTSHNINDIVPGEWTII